MLQVIGFIGALAIGLVLGLLGGGGSILTVPILTYLFGISAERATSYSLFVVFTSSLVGCLSHFSKRNVAVKVSAIFILPALVGVSLSRSVVLPGIPMTYPKDGIILLVFATVMLWSAASMLKSTKSEADHRVGPRLSVVAVLGGLAGLVMGFVGAGGGFIIVPVLVTFGNLSMHQAIGSSLFVITTSTLVGFINDVLRGVAYDWSFLFLFSGIALIGVLIGSRLNARVSPLKLKKSFGLLVVVVSVWVIYKELSGRGH